MLTRNIKIDDQKLNDASLNLVNVSDQMSDLVKRIEKIISELENGFKTDAGTKFIKLCREELLKPMTDQANVISIMSDTLKESKNEYKPVFDEYKALNDTIRNL